LSLSGNPVKLTPSTPDFRILFESAPGLYLVLKPDLTIAAVSDAYLNATMTKREDIIGRGVFDVFPGNPDDAAATGVSNLRAPLERVLQNQALDAMAVQKYDIRRPESEGGGFEERYWSPVNSPILNGGEEVLYIFHRAEDVRDFVRLKRLGTEERKLTLQSQTRSEEMESEVYLRAQELQEANRQLRTANEPLAKKDEEREHIEVALRKAHAELEVRVQERTSELEAALAALRASEEGYRLLFESNPHPMWVFDVETLAFLAVNDAAVVHYGYAPEEFLAMTIADIRPAPDVPRLLEAVRELSSEVPVKLTLRHRKKDGTLIDVDISSREISFGGRRGRLVLATDITERTHLEDQFRQSQKMEAVGRLAGGVAHDFNNMLTAIIGYSELLLGQVADEKLRGEIGEILSAGHRAAALTNQLLAFSRRQVLQPKVLVLNEVVVNIEKLLRRLIGEDIELVTIPREGLGQIKVDPGQMEQIIMNLAVNARDAMPNGGKLTIETANIELGEAYTLTHPEVTPGHYVLLAVSDNGIGMDAETQSHIFEPFFTTKEQGKGTGLGLSTVYGIVTQSGGHIWLYSEPGLGATFKIYIPRIDEAAASIEEHLGMFGSLEGSETIMLVEDDDAVRELATLTLEQYGYTVLPAESGTQALEFLGPLAVIVDLVVTDVIMPRMSGPALVALLKQMHPETKVLYISGYTEDATIQHGVLDHGVEFLQKPFTPEGLAQKVREVLDKNTA
jgi:two-component system, cell cycle sensor histidine kinase and response regulator CckA